MEELLLCAAAVAVLMGLGVLVEAAQPRRWGARAEAGPLGDSRVAQPSNGRTKSAVKEVLS
jgi:hypothetical protein